MTHQTPEIPYLNTAGGERAHGGRKREGGVRGVMYTYVIFTLLMPSIYFWQTLESK